MICADLLGLLVTVSCYMALVPDPVSEDLELECISPAVGFTTVAGKGSSFSKAYVSEESAAGGDGVHTEKLQGDFYIVGKQIYDETEEKQKRSRVISRRSGGLNQPILRAQTKNDVAHVRESDTIKGYRIGYR